MDKYLEFKLKLGFSLLEIMIAIAIMVIITVVAVLNVRPLLARYQQQQAIARLSSLIARGWQRALTNGVIHKVEFDMNSKRVALYEQAPSAAQQKKDKDTYKLVRGSYIDAPFVWPDSWQIRQFYIEGFDEMSRFSGNRKTAKIWFFIMPQGISQAVTLNITDTNTNQQISLVVNPFSAQVQLYDTFQKP